MAYGGPARWVLIAALGIGAAAAPIRPADARNWGSIDFRLGEEGMMASERVADQVGITSTYQRLMDGELLTDEETFTIYEDVLDDNDVYRVEVDRYDRDLGGTVRTTVFLDRLTLRPLQSRHRLQGSRQGEELVYERDGAVVMMNGTTARSLKTSSDTVDYFTVQLMFLKFLDDISRLKYSFLFNDVLYKMVGRLRDIETVVLESGTYETLHVVCKMRSTWAHLTPALHYWIETSPPYRLVRYQVKSEVVELVE